MTTFGGAKLYPFADIFQGDTVCIYFFQRLLRTSIDAQRTQLSWDFKETNFVSNSNFFEYRIQLDSIEK